MNEWLRDHSQRWVTPGGDPVWVCGNCFKGQHCYGIESRPRGVCPDCGSKNEYGNKIWDGKEIYGGKDSY